MKFDLHEFHRNVTDEELIQDLQFVACKLRPQGECLTFRAYKKLGKYSPHTISARFGSWNDGLKIAGLNPAEEKNIPTETLMDNLKLVWIAKGKQPVFRDMAVSPSQYSATVYTDRFGSWRKALEEFVRFIEREAVNVGKPDMEVRREKRIKRTKRDPSLSLRFLVLRRDSFRCSACGRSPAGTAGLVLEVDHVIPWSQGGETVEVNLQTLCLECNRGKAARL